MAAMKTLYSDYNTCEGCTVLVSMMIVSVASKKHPMQPKTTPTTDNRMKEKNDLFIPDGLCGDGGFRPPEKETKQSELSDFSFASSSVKKNVI